MGHVCPLHPQEQLDKREADTQWGHWEYLKCPVRGCFICCGAHQVDTYLPAVADHPRDFFRQLPLTKMKCFCSNTPNLTMSNSERNPGRLFFKCVKRECDFFQWANEDPWGDRKRWLEGEKFMTLFSGQVVKRKPQDVLWETPLQKGVREIIDKHMAPPPDTTPQGIHLPQGNKDEYRWRRTPQDNNWSTTLVKERVDPQKEGMGPYEGNWHPDDAKLPRIGYMKKLEDWYLSK